MLAVRIEFSKKALERCGLGRMHFAPRSSLERRTEAITIGREEGGKAAVSRNQSLCTAFILARQKYNLNGGPVWLTPNSIIKFADKCAVQLGEHVGVQIAASGFRQVSI